MSMSMSKSKLWILGTALVGVVVLLAGYFLLIGPKRAEAAELREQTTETVASNAQLESRVAQLKAQFAELPQRQAELAAIKQAMPEDAALPSLVRDLDKLAADAGVTLISLAPGEPTLVAPATPVAPAPESTDGAEESTDATAAVPVAPAGNVLASLPVSIVVVGDFYEAELFLKAVQADMPRALLVTGLTVTAEQPAAAGGGKPATVHGDVSMTIAGSVFILKPASAGAPVTADAAPGATAGN